MIRLLMDSVTPLAAVAKLFLACGADGSMETVLAEDKNVEELEVTDRMVLTISVLASTCCVWPAMSRAFHHLSQDLAEMSGADAQLLRLGSGLDNIRGSLVQNVGCVGELILELAIRTATGRELALVNLPTPLVNLLNGGLHFSLAWQARHC